MPIPADIIEILRIHPDLLTESEMEYYINVYTMAKRVAESIGIDTLVACVEEGPIAEGCEASKHQRDQLYALKLITPIVVKGQQGFWAATYTGQRVLSVAEYLIHGKVR